MKSVNPQKEIQSLYEIINTAAAKKNGEDESAAIGMVQYLRVWSKFNQDERSMVLASAGLRREVSVKSSWFDLNEGQKIKVANAINRLRQFVAKSPIMEGVA